MERMFSVKSMLVSISLISLVVILLAVTKNYYFSKQEVIVTGVVSQDIEVTTDSQSSKVATVSSETTQKTAKPVVEQKKTESVAKNTESDDKLFKYEDTLIKNSKGLSRDVLHLALKAYYNAAQDDGVENHKLTIIDYSKPSNQKRMWMIDMDKKTVELNTYVSHGVKSGDKVAKQFSNKMESHMSSIGVMKTGTIYTGKRGMSLHLHGLEDDINDNVYNRHVVIHGSNYVNDAIAKAKGKIGKSLGCPAVDYKVAKPLIQKIAGGSLVFAYYPLKSWLQNSEYL